MTGGGDSNSTPPAPPSVGTLTYFITDTTRKSLLTSNSNSRKEGEGGVGVSRRLLRRQDLRERGTRVLIFQARYQPQDLPLPRLGGGLPVLRVADQVEEGGFLPQAGRGRVASSASASASGPPFAQYILSIPTLMNEIKHFSRNF